MPLKSRFISIAGFTGCVLQAVMILSGTVAQAAGPVGIGWTPFGDVTTAGYVAPDGKLMLFDGGAAGWTLRPVDYPHALVPGAPLALLPQTAGDVWPTVITVSASQKLVRVINGGFPQILLPSQVFPVGTPLQLVRTGAKSLVLLVSAAGDIWAVDPLNGQSQKVNGPSEKFPIGSTVSAVSAGGQFHAFAVDQSGTMHYYFGKGVVWGSMPIAGQLLPGTSVAADEFSMVNPPVNRLNVAAIDPAGRLLLWSKPAGQTWQAPVAIAKGQTPGAPLQVGHTPYGPMLSTISAGGKWNVWIHDPQIGWQHQLVGVGYTTGAPIACAPTVGTFFTVDPLGRLISANWNGTAWTTGYALFDGRPQLVSRKVIPNPPLPPATVTLQNPSSDPLVVQIVDRFDPRQPPEETIAAGGQTAVSLARDSGAVLEEVFLVPGIDGIVREQVETHPIPPEERYTLTVWSDKETYRVLPFKGAPKGAPKTVTEGFSQRSQVSLGVIPIPAGELLQDGEQLDLISTTKRLRNAGAVVHFPKPISQP